MNTNLTATNQQITQEEHLIQELKAKLKTLIENTNHILSKTKQVESHTDKLQADTDAKNDELHR